MKNTWLSGSFDGWYKNCRMRAVGSNSTAFRKNVNKTH